MVPKTGFGTHRSALQICCLSPGPAALLESHRLRTAAGTESPDAPPSGSPKTPARARPPPPPYVHHRTRSGQGRDCSRHLLPRSCSTGLGTALGLPRRRSAETHLPTTVPSLACTRSSNSSSSSRLSSQLCPSSLTHSPSDVAGPACCPLPPHSHITPLTQPGAAASLDAGERYVHLPPQ